MCFGCDVSEVGVACVKPKPFWISLLKNLVVECYLVRRVLTIVVLVNMVTKTQMSRTAHVIVTWEIFIPLFFASRFLPSTALSNA